MTPERWQQIDTLFQSAVARGADECAAYLDEACADDQALRNEVEALLASHEEAGSFLNAPAFQAAAERLAGEHADLMTGKTVGHRKVLSLLGAGGMGVIYVAQESRRGRRVALKLLPDHFTSDEQRVRRFRQEARAVLALNHPNIVTIYEMGEIEGTQFIATEFIKGETLPARLSARPDGAERGVGRGVASRRRVG